jgi:hypothetical protein
VALRLDHLQQREEHWAIVDLVGKRGHVRTVPVPDWVRTELDDGSLQLKLIEENCSAGSTKLEGRRWHDGEGGLAHCEGIRQAHRRGEVGATRSATLCSALPCFGRRVGADPIPPGACLRSNDRTIRVNDHIGIEPNP